MKRSLQMMTATVFLTFLFSLAILFWSMSDRAFSELENRSLQSAPRFSFQAFLSGEYSNTVNDYFADQFPMRDFWVEQKANFELLWGKRENNGILIGENDTLARRLHTPICANGAKSSKTDAFDPMHVQDSLLAIRRTEERSTVPFHTLLAGRNVDVSAAAFDYPDEFSRRLWTQIEEVLGADSLTVLHQAQMKARFERGEYVYYRTDHHWTSLGAYYAYCALMEDFGLADETLPESTFQKKVASDTFYGSLHSASGLRFVSPDTVEIWDLISSSEFEIVADGKRLDGFYQTAHLSKKDKYSIFLDGTHDVVTVRKLGEENRPSLLIVKDSFANSIAPFLAQHFDLILVNLSSSKRDYTNVSQLASDYSADRVLLLYSVENMITADKLTRLH